jgi:outer membrane protein OmpA-like peptidoglycan-associated protein
MRRGRIFALALAASLAACQTPPPVRPSGPTAAERQQTTLHSLGFVKTDDGWLLNLPEPISFALNKDELKPTVQESIARTAAELLKANVRHLRIEGHTDNSGPREYNVMLSLRRAQTVAHEFINNGFAEGDISEQGLGPDSPISSNETRDGRATNRCVLIIIPVDALAQ